LEKLQLANGFVKKELFLLSKNNCMNRIILIGNGFDLAHGLKTSYKDFIDWFWKKEIEKIADTSSWREKHIAYKKTDKYYFDSDYIKIESITPPQDLNVSTYDKLINLEYVCQPISQNISQIIESGTKTTFKNNFLKVISEKSYLYNWGGIEEEYYEQLKACAKTNDTKKLEKLNEEFKQIKDELKQYLLEKIKKETKKIESLAHYMYSQFKWDDFTKEGKNNFLEEVLKLVQSNQNNNSIENTKDRNAYFLDYVNKFLTFKSTPLTKEDLTTLIERHSKIKESISVLPQKVLSLSFNYTYNISKYSRWEYYENNGLKYEFSKFDNPIYIHGTLEDSNNPMIFGYGDELANEYKEIENLNNNEYLKNVKSINYLKTDNYKKLLQFIELDKYQIFIMGHSCGNSDRTLLNTLFEHPNCVSIKPFYYKNSDGTNDYEEKIMNISRNFNDKKAFREKVVNEKDCVALPQAEKL